MEPFALPFAVHVHEYDDPIDLLDTLVLGPFLAGAQPWCGAERLQRVRPEAALQPPGSSPVRVARDGRAHSALLVGDGWTLLVNRWPADRTARLIVTAVTREVGEAVLAGATDGAVEPARPRDEVTVAFWHLTNCGAHRRLRSITAPDWRDIRGNYASTVAVAFDELVGLSPGDLNGRLLLFHGPPGTGKTTALRALAQGWRSWCRTECVLDPERLLDESGYLMEVAAGEEEAGDENDNRPRRWRLVILEDCDELIRAGAKEGAGQRLSRLLNITDGLMGQGLDVLVALTTNEPLAALHPAVVRPGRCLAEIEVGPLPRREAAAWLGTSAGIGPDGATLAELYALRGEAAKVERAEPRRVVGLYL